MAWLKAICLIVPGQVLFFRLNRFYDVSTIEGYLLPNIPYIPYIYILNMIGKNIFGYIF